MSGLELTGLPESIGVLKKNRVLLLLCGALLLGVTCGAYAAGSSTTAFGAENIFRDFLSARDGQNFFMTLLHSLLSQAGFLLVSYLFGLCLLGAPMAFVLPFIKGLGMGLVGGYLYSVHALQGIGFYALILLPGEFVASLALLMAGREAFRFSHRLFGMLKPSSGAEPLYDSFRIYSAKYLIFLLFMAGASLVNAVMSSTFLKLFSF